MNTELAHILYEILVVLGASMAVLVLCARIHIPSVVGLVLTGFLIGPAGLGLIPEREMVELFAEVGVVLLLFSIGLELSLDKLARARRAFLVGGPLQALLTALVTIAVCMALGLDLQQSVYVAFLIILSSTAVVLKIYGERKEIQAPHGELSLGVLLFQDLLLVPMVVVTPLLAGGSGGDLTALAARLGGAVLASLAAFLLARVLLPPLLRLVASSGARETFLLGALLLGLGMAYLTGILGLSPALGAFLAGVAAAETDYHHQLMADVGPFRDVFTSLFFVSIGMLVVLPESPVAGAIVLVLALAIVVVKTITGYVAIRFAGFTPRPALTASLGLAQLGEFSFLLMAIGLRNNLLAAGVQDTILAAAVVTLLLTPLAIRVAPALADRLSREVVSPGREPVEDDQHVVLVGYGFTSQIVGQVLSAAGFDYRVVDLNSEEIARARADGHPVLFGDVARPEILEALAIERAQVLVLSISDLRAQRQIIQLARGMNSSLRIVTVARGVDEIGEASRLGSDRVVSLEFESALEVMQEVLETFHVPRNVIRAQLRALRGEDYSMLRARRLSGGVSQAVLDALVQGTTEVARIASGSPAIGRTLSQLHLRRESGASVIAVVREGTSMANPSADLELKEGDDLVLVGDHAQVDSALGLIRPPA